MKWPTKDPDEEVDLSVDWSRFLGDKTISNSRWKIKYNSTGEEVFMLPSFSYDTLEPKSYSYTDTVATMVMAGGTANITYKIINVITTNDDLSFERTIRLPVRNK